MRYSIKKNRLDRYPPYFAALFIDLFIDLVLF